MALAALCLVVAGGCGSLSSQALNAQGVREYNRGQYQTAMRRFYQAMYEDPANPDGYYNLAETLHRTARLYNRPEDLEQAEHNYHLCLVRDPDHQQCHRGLAVLLMDQGREDEAVALLERWVRERPSLAAPKIELARLNEELDRKEQAEGQLLAALEVEPENATVHAALGRLREERGEYRQALVDYRRSQLYNPAQPHVDARIAALSNAVGSAAVLAPTQPGTRVVSQRTPRLR
jgi:tetratricopeptide (TPR) repeat protein